MIKIYCPHDGWFPGETVYENDCSTEYHEQERGKEGNSSNSEKKDSDSWRMRNTFKGIFYSILPK